MQPLQPLTVRNQCELSQTWTCIPYNPREWTLKTIEIKGIYFMIIKKLKVIFYNYEVGFHVQKICKSFPSAWRIYPNSNNLAVLKPSAPYKSDNYWRFYIDSCKKSDFLRHYRKNKIARNCPIFIKLTVPKSQDLAVFKKTHFLNLCKSFVPRGGEQFTNFCGHGIPPHSYLKNGL